jgi:hypothetical protein
MIRADKSRVKIYSTPRQLIVAVILIFFALSTSITFSIVYTNRVDRESNQAWCDIINGLNDRYQKLEPNSDPNGLEFARQIAALKHRYGC